MGKRPKKRRISGRRFIQLWTNVKRSAAYHSCNVYARAALVELLDRYTGCNNGMISMSVREIAELLDCAASTAAKALTDLDDAGLARPVNLGRWRGKIATTWRLTFYRCDATGELPITDWKPRRLRSSGSTQGPSERVLRSPGSTQKPKSSMNRSTMRSSGSTHIDIHHAVDALTVTPGRGRRH